MCLCIHINIPYMKCLGVTLPPWASEGQSVRGHLLTATEESAPKNRHLKQHGKLASQAVIFSRSQSSPFSSQLTRRGVFALSTLFDSPWAWALSRGRRLTLNTYAFMILHVHFHVHLSLCKLGVISSWTSAFVCVCACSYPQHSPTIHETGAYTLQISPNHPDVCRQILQYVIMSYRA